MHRITQMRTFNISKTIKQKAMKTTVKQTTATTEKGTVINMTVTAIRGFEMVDVELFNDGDNSIVKQGKETNKTTVVLTINGKNYEGTLSVMPVQMQKERGCYAIFGNIGLSEKVYNELNSVVLEAKKEAEEDATWLELQAKKEANYKMNAEYDAHVKMMNNAMGN